MARFASVQSTTLDLVVDTCSDRMRSATTLVLILRDVLVLFDFTDIVAVTPGRVTTKPAHRISPLISVSSDRVRMYLVRYEVGNFVDRGILEKIINVANEQTFVEVNTILVRPRLAGGCATCVVRDFGNSNRSTPDRVRFSD